MACAACGRANPPDARFCAGCGTQLASRCPACGADAAPDARFCVACGASLSGRPAEAGGERKVVTIVFADLAGSTALHERLDVESARAFMDRYYRAMRAAVEAHRGSVTQLLGDGVKAVFGAPRVAEDDALRAVRAAVAMQVAFRELSIGHGDVVGDVGLRVAVNTGEVVARGETEIIGDPVNVAARLQQEAGDGDVLVGESTRRLVGQLVTLAPFGTFSLKGRAEPVSAHRVVSLERPPGVAAIAFLGREDELRQLLAVYDDAVTASDARLAVILGSPGLGKSRLLDELGRRLGDRADVLMAQCNAAGGATFEPIAAALRVRLGIGDGTTGDALRAAIVAAIAGADRERDRIVDGVAALLAGTPASPEETFFVVRRLLTALAASRPVVLAIDDLQWAESLLLDLIEHLVQWSRAVPLVVLAAARPELRETRSSLATPGGLVAAVVTLAGLDAVTATRLAASVIGADVLPAAIAGRVLATSEGNPLFVGELVRMLVHDGALVRDGDRWTAGVELAALEMPPTIHALLAARIERLRPEERAVLERAAVIGRRFSRTALAHLLPSDAADVDARLESLRRSELIEPDTGWFLGEPALRFHHVLIRDAAYRGLLKHTRAELHGRFADWLEVRVGDAAEHDETIGWHLEQAHHHLSELGPVDARGRALGERASRRLAAAGRRALSRDDVALAAGLLSRALDRLDAADPARPDLVLDGCEALLAAGEVGAAAAAIDGLARLTGGSARLRAWHTCFAGQLAALTDPKVLRETADAVAAAAGELASAGDPAGEAKAHSVHATALMRLGEIGACEAALDRALAAARHARDRRRVNAVLAGAPLAALWGPSPVTRASGRCLDVVRVLRITQGAPAVEAVALRCQAVLEALRGRSEAARRMIASSRRMVEELGITQGLLEVEASAGLVELIEGDAAAAERSFCAAYDGFRDHGLGIDAARAAALLGRALLAQGRAAEAEVASRESEALAGDDLQAAITWRCVRAEALARRGEHASAIDFAGKAVETAAATDALLHHADARLALAAALRAGGRGAEADAEERLATSLWEAKGATLLADRLRSRSGRAPELEPAEPQRSRRRVHRRVAANAATALLARWDAALATRDIDRIGSMVNHRTQVVHHPTGAVYDRSGVIASARILFDAEKLAVTNEPLATLGERLALCSMSASLGEMSGDDFPPFGTVEANTAYVMVEVDADGQTALREEWFGEDHLCDAVVRLYECHAELLPDGPERERAAATARSVATVLGEIGLDRYAAAFAPAVEFADHRPLGFPPTRGADAYLRRHRTLVELSASISLRTDDVLGVRSDGLLVRRMNLGTDGAGGDYERPSLMLWVFDPDGLVIRNEMFGEEDDANALARFDELAAGPPAPRATSRRVRPNAATANAARDAECRQEPIAALGLSLALCRTRTFASASVGRDFDAGAVEREQLTLIEVDAGGRRRRSEVFADDHLGEAIARLYERHAELLPAGPERDLAAVTARSVAAMMGLDLDRWATALAETVLVEDRRALGLGVARGPEALLRAVGSLIEMSEAVVARHDDVLDVRSDGLLVHRTNVGTSRVSGGAYERPFLMLCVFGPDGLLARLEQFDSDREVEALVRLDELTGAPLERRPVRRRVPANAATANAARFEAAVAARDVDAIADVFSESTQTLNHSTGATYHRDGILTTFGGLGSLRKLAWREEPLASLGESLALVRASLSAAGFTGERFDVGAFERENVSLIEVDAGGRRLRSEVFAADRFGNAVARLYERHAEMLPAGLARDRAAAIARAVAAFLGALDLERCAAATAPDVEAADHRRVGFESAGGADALLRALATAAEIGDGLVGRVDDILAATRAALLLCWTTAGTDRAGGGRFEWHFLRLFVFGPDGRLTRYEIFESDCESEALARLDELTGEPSAARVENAAWRALQEFERCWAERDWEGVLATYHPAHRMEDRRKLMRLTVSGHDFLANERMLFEETSSRWRSEQVATRGDRLALCRVRFTAEVGASGPMGVEMLDLVEVDAGGQRVALVVFDPDDVDAAFAELDAHYGATTMSAFFGELDARNWDAVAAWFAPDLVVEDHRRLGWDTLHGAAAYLEALRDLIELAPDVRVRTDHAEESDRGALVITTTLGTREGGAFEIPRVVVLEREAGGRVRRLDMYDLDELDAARARFAELREGAGRAG